MKFRSLGISLAACLLALLSTSGVTAKAQQPATQPATSSNSKIPPQALLQPSELSQMLGTQEKLLVFQVGSHVLYAEAHIPGSEYVGAAGTSAGIEALRKRVSHLRKDQRIVIYCGCCPWGRCPNIRPAYEQLHALGFTGVRVLYLADNFGDDWVAKGYPVTRGR